MQMYGSSSCRVYLNNIFGWKLDNTSIFIWSVIFRLFPDRYRFQTPLYSPREKPWEILENKHMTPFTKDIVLKLERDQISLVFIWDRGLE